MTELTGKPSSRQDEQGPYGPGPGAPPSPAGIITKLVLSVLAAELVVMVLLFLVSDSVGPLAMILIDAPLLVLILSPALYLFLFKPLLSLIETRRKTEKALVRESNRLRKYLEVAGVMVVALDTKGRVALVNRKGCEVLGYREEEIVGKEWFSNFLPPEIRAEVSIVFNMLVSGDLTPPEAEGYYENPVLTRSGGKRAVLWHNSVLTEDGRIIGVLSSGEDITERKLTEKALKESEARYRLVHNTAFDGIIIANSQDSIIDCNDSAARIFGYQRDALIGRQVSMIIPERYRESHRQGLRRFLDTGESRVQGQIAEYEGLRKGGEVFPLELALNNFTLGGAVHFTAMIRDITDRKKAEAEREIMQARLSQSQKMEAIGTFAGGIAHDFNNILTAIRGNAELALEDTAIESQLRSKLDGIVNSVLLASRLTRQLLLFSKGQPFEVAALDVNKVIGDILHMLGRLIGSDITITTSLAPETWVIEADEGNIEQVLMNLAVNARDAMPDGGQLTIRTDNVVVDTRMAASMPNAKEGEAVCLTVSDTGVGMKKELLGRIFEPFFTTKEAGHGTGFGLSVVYAIMRQHNGWITVQSEPDRGTTFSLYFPAMSRTKTGAPQHPSVHPAAGNGEKILLVEDDPTVRDFTAAALAERGFEVIPVGSAGEASDAFDSEGGALDLVLCDIVLSDKSGFDLVDALLAKNPRLAVVITSGFPESSKRPLLGGRWYSYLQKPYTIAGLLKAVGNSLSGRGN